MKLNLDKITPICIDGRDIDDLKLERYREIISFMSDRVTFKEIVFVGARDLELPSVRFIKTDKMTIGEYSNFCIKRLNSFYSSDYCLIFQDDGFILNPELWDNDFYNYDYIGAPWPLYIGWPKEGMQVGNGGFSLRSRKFTTVSASLQSSFSNEDTYILIKNRKTLNDNGIKIAEVDIAKKFSVEISMDPLHGIENCFGFHAKHLLNDAIKYMRNK